MRLRSDALIGGTLSFLIAFKAFREFAGFVIQRSQRPSGQSAAKPNRRRHPRGGARCCFFGNEWETRRADVPATPRSRTGEAMVSLAGWRRGWDSNPRYAWAYSGFRDRHVQPLPHLSDLRAHFTPREIKARDRWPGVNPYGAATRQEYAPRLRPV